MDLTKKYPRLSTRVEQVWRLLVVATISSGRRETRTDTETKRPRQKDAHAEKDGHGQKETDRDRQTSSGRQRQRWTETETEMDRKRSWGPLITYMIPKYMYADQVGPCALNAM